MNRRVELQPGNVASWRSHPGIALLQRIILAAGVVLALILFERLSSTSGLSPEIKSGAVLLLLGILVLSVGFGLAIWSALVRLLTGVRPSLKDSMVGLASLIIGKYIPGKVVGLVGRLSSVHPSVSEARATGLVVIEQIVLFIGILVVAAPAFIHRVSGQVGFDWLFVLLVFLVLGGVTAVTLFIGLLPRRLRAVVSDGLLAAGCRQSACWAIAGVILMAVLQALLVTASVIPVAEMVGIIFSWQQAFWLISAYASSILLGMIAFVLPGGIGAREGAFVWLSAPLLDAETALALAAALRLVNVVFDLAVGALGTVLSNSKRGRAAR